MNTMKVEFSEDTKAALEQYAKKIGKAPESLVVEAVKRILEDKPWKAAHARRGTETISVGNIAVEDMASEFFSEWHITGP